MVGDFVIFSAGLFVGALIALRYIAPLIYQPIIDALRLHNRKLEASNAQRHDNADP